MNASDDFIKAKNTVFLLLKFRQRSEYEIAQHLRRKQISGETIKEVIRFFKKANLVNDNAFAKSWVQARLLKPFGAQRIRLELRQKGIRDDIIAEQLRLIDHENIEFKAVATLVRKCILKYQRLDRTKLKRRTIEYLLRRGFKAGMILGVLNKILNERNDLGTYDSE